MWIYVQFFVAGEDLLEILLKARAPVLRVDARQMKWPCDRNQCRQRQ
jgi:hypothetical protein